MTYGSKIIDLERDKAVSQEKLQNITNLLESSNSGYSEEVEKLQAKIAELETRTGEEII